mmetsp:Transcript_3827/g.11047  ORF Transcript_3827/g.11047 Transcript_3827/m.11047 type:complete len:533 (-) Transcript_3827:775-2373(-)
MHPGTPGSSRKSARGHGGRSRGGWLAILPTRWRSQELGLGVLAALALFFVLRLTMRQSRDGSSFRTVLKTTQVMHHGQVGADEVVTEVVIDSGRVNDQRTEDKGASSGTGVSKVIAALDAQLPKDFDWKTYMLYHPDLQVVGITSEEQAKDHYLKQGRAEGRIYKRLRVLLRYTACTGLINQHYSHIASFVLAAVLGAEVVLPPAAKRDSFANYFSVYKEHNEVSWSSAPLDSLLNVDKLIDVWREKGLVVHKTPALLPFPDLTAPEVAYPAYAQPGVDPATIAHMSGVYLENLDMPELIEKARRAVMDTAGALLRADPNRDLQQIVLDLPCTFFMLRSLSNLRAVTEVARTLEFAPSIEAMADRVVAAIHSTTPVFNAVHLRIERDAKDWAQIMGGPEALWNAYVQAMRQAGFSRDTPMYVASGLLTYGASDDMNRIIALLKAAGLCSEVLYKELYVDEKEVAALNSEQKALLDFLVLAKGKAFVGLGSSTFSFYLREYRVLKDLPRSTSVIVDTSVIGTDPLFHSAGTVA